MKKVPQMKLEDEGKWNKDFDAMKAKIQKKLSQSALLGEAIANTSTEDTEIVVVSMPFPSPTISPFTFMAMLDLTSSPSNKPFLFLRGTQKRILSMDS